MKLFESTKLGSMKLKNRVVMAPLTRSRAIGNVPNDLMATYYSQRAGAGLIISEGTSPSVNGLGYARIPGIYSHEQVAGWKKTTNAVHSKGASIFLQVMHTGRVSHPANMPKDAKVLAPSAIGISGQMWTDSDGEQSFPVPTAMTEDEIKLTIEEYVTAAKLAIEAGFDGVELHAANGYLVDQFLSPLSNKRTDSWGATPEGRMKFALEIAKQTAARIGADRVGIRLSPYGVFNDMGAFEGIDDFYVQLATEVSKLKLAYIHLVDHSSMGAPTVKPELKKNIRDAFRGSLILSGGYDASRANVDLQENKGDLIAFGRPFISNPNLVELMKTKGTLKEPDPSKFYTPGPEGYTDY